MTKENQWPPVLPASFPQPPVLVDAYSGLARGDLFQIKGERTRFRFIGGDPTRDHLYATELHKGVPAGQRCFHGNQFKKKVKR